MDNILYIGPYREFSGIGNASRAYIKALMRTGDNISIRPVYNIDKVYPLDEQDNELLELENNFSKKYHKIIQHCYPHQLCYSSNFDQHICIIHLDSFGYHSNILQYLSIMDKIIVGSDTTKHQTLDLLKHKTYVIPEPIDIDEIENYKNTNDKQPKDNFSFYCIADWISKKNIDKIVLNFIRLSSLYDNNLDLVIKTKSHTSTNDDIKNYIEYDLSKIYKLFYRNNIRKPKIIVGEINKNSVYYIHHNNDCLINISSGESFGYSTLESICFNNNIVVNNKSVNKQFLTEDGLSVTTEFSYCLDDEKIYPIYNTFDQYWENPSSNSLYSRMYEAINESDNQKSNRIKEQKEKIRYYSMDNVAQLFKSI